MTLRRLTTALMAAVASAQTLPQPKGWPQFTYGGVVTDKSTFKYNPTNEFIFPSVFHAGQYLSEPLAEWYLYYAPHDNPGGISLVYADDLNGPWTEYANNPIIKNKTPQYSVPHVSSPDALYHEESGRILMYFHGNNGQTRWAWSNTNDGTSFKYGGIALQNSQVSTEATETSYARVFRHPNKLSSFKYAMFFMSNEKDNRRKIRLAESVNGKTWQAAAGYLVVPGPEEGANVSGPDLWSFRGKYYIIYHASSGKSYARTIDASLRNVGSVPILLHQSSGSGGDTGRVASPQVVTSGTETFLFYESGDRLGATIAWARSG